MKTSSNTLALLLLAIFPVLASCNSINKKSSPDVVTANSGGKEKTKATTGGNPKKSDQPSKSDDLDDYSVVEISDPLEPLNRATFRLNEGLYTALFRPISKGYEKVLPETVRKGINNAFENVKFPVRFVNCTLQFNFKRAGQETGKFVVNTIVGIGGLGRPSDKIAALANVPDSDTGQTFAKWGIGHGAYLVLPFIGPSSVRDGIGYLGDYALNPVDWGMFWHNPPFWTNIPPAANTLRATPGELKRYDTATEDAVDSYISLRSAYIQNRAEAARK